MTTEFKIDRRRSLQKIAVAGLGAALAACSVPRQRFEDETISKPSGLTDADILNFALNLEYLEAAYYTLGTTGRAPDADAGAGPGPVTGGAQVPFQTSALREFAEELARDETAHVRTIRATLGPAAISRPPIDFRNAFSGAADAAGLGADFDPFASETAFFLGSMLFEDVGVTAYMGAAPLISDKKILAAAASIHAVESYHGGLVRSQLILMGQDAWRAGNALASARDRLDGSQRDDQGIAPNGRINVAPTDASGIAFARTPQEVLRVVFLTGQPGATRGGFFPNGVNGAIRTA